VRMTRHGCHYIYLACGCRSFVPSAVPLPSVIVSSASDQYADRATALDVYGLFGQLGRAVFEHDIRSSRRRMLIRAGWSVPVDAHY